MLCKNKEQMLNIDLVTLVLQLRVVLLRHLLRCSIIGGCLRLGRLRPVTDQGVLKVGSDRVDGGQASDGAGVHCRALVIINSATSDPFAGSGPKPRGAGCCRVG